MHEARAESVAEAAQVMVEVPRLLRDCSDGRAELAIAAATLGAALDRMRADWPTLATHVFDETGAVRPHVLILHNGKATRWMPSLDVPLRDGDRLQILQAVSGG